MKILKCFFALVLAVGLSSCFPEEFTQQANNQFGDQHFKTAIQLIELHKIREGEYPLSLDSLKYLGDWDQIIFSSVEYRRLSKGYQLDLTRGVFGDQVKLKYPADFWNGLGLVKSNLK